MDYYQQEQLLIREFTRVLMEAAEPDPDVSGKYFDYWIDKTNDLNGYIADGKVQSSILVSAEGEYSSGNAGTISMVKLDEPPKTVYRLGSTDYKSQSDALHALVDQHEKKVEQLQKDDEKTLASPTFIAYNAKTGKIVMAKIKDKPVTELEGKTQADAAKQKESILKKYGISDISIIGVINKTPIYRAS